MEVMEVKEVEVMEEGQAENGRMEMVQCLPLRQLLVVVVVLLKEIVGRKSTK